MERIERGLLDEIARRRAKDLVGRDLLSRLLVACDDGVVPPHELAGQAFVLFFAGHDTTTCGLTWTLFLLAQHPEIADAARAEVRAELGDRLPTFDDLPRLVELDRVIKESLRLFPPGMMFGRICCEDTEILGFPVARGSEVIWSPYVTHRDPAVFEEPSRFVPDRWRDASPTEFEYLPFGSGARRCIGASFAAMELRSVIAQIVQRFRVRVVDGLRIDPLVNPILAPKQPLRVVLEPVDAPGRSATLRGQITEMLGSSPVASRPIAPRSLLDRFPL
jgi:cytochrome P450